MRIISTNELITLYPFFEENIRGCENFPCRVIFDEPVPYEMFEWLHQNVDCLVRSLYIKDSNKPKYILFLENEETALELKLMCG